MKAISRNSIEGITRADAIKILADEVDYMSESLGVMSERIMAGLWASVLTDLVLGGEVDEKTVNGWAMPKLGRDKVSIRA